MAMKHPKYRSTIPVEATEKIEEYFDSGAKKSATYFLDHKKVGYRLWHPNGLVDIEYSLRDGQKHGVELHFNETGRLFFMEPFRNGRIHGTAKQWSHDGMLLVSYKLTNGIGLDLWCNDTATLSEEHYWPADGELGYRRNWNEDVKTIWEEYFFVNGKGFHGIWRDWNTKGKLRRGFPHYYVNNERVKKLQYLKACAIDLILPRYRVKDDLPNRKPPPEYLAQRKKPKSPAGA